MTGKMITYNLLRAGTSSHILPKTSSRVLFILCGVHVLFILRGVHVLFVLRGVRFVFVAV